MSIVCIHTSFIRNSRCRQPWHNRCQVRDVLDVPCVQSNVLWTESIDSKFVTSEPTDEKKWRWRAPIWAVSTSNGMICTCTSTCHCTIATDAKYVSIAVNVINAWNKRKRAPASQCDGNLTVEITMGQFHLHKILNWIEFRTPFAHFLTVSFSVKFRNIIFNRTWIVVWTRLDSHVWIFMIRLMFTDRLFVVRRYKDVNFVYRLIDSHQSIYSQNSNFGSESVRKPSSLCICVCFFSVTMTTNDIKSYSNTTIRNSDEKLNVIGCMPNPPTTLRSLRNEFCVFFVFFRIRVALFLPHTQQVKRSERRRAQNHLTNQAKQLSNMIAAFFCLSSQFVNYVITIFTAWLDE